MKRITSILLPLGILAAASVWIISLVWLAQGLDFEPLTVFFGATMSLALLLKDELEKGIRRLRRNTNRQPSDEQRLESKIKSSWIEGALIDLLENRRELAPEMTVELHGNANIQHNTKRAFYTTQIKSVFIQPGNLLILGEPGSGKTVLLLQLADQLFQTRLTSRDPNAIPVILSLSSWDANIKSFDNWLVREMASQYRMPERISSEFISQGKVILLLDGLDEVTVASRNSCVQKLNEFTEKNLSVKFVVTCRHTEYNMLDSELHHYNRVIIQNLQESQVENYLNSHVDKYSGFQMFLKKTPEIKSGIAANPLLLGMMLNIFEDASISSIQAVFEDTIEPEPRIIQTYLQKRLTTIKEFSYTDSLRYLTWISNELHKQHRRIHFFESIQPDSLTKTLHKTYRFLLGTVYLALYGIAFFFLSLLFLDWESGLWFGLYSGLVCGVAVSMRGGVGFGIVGAIYSGISIVAGFAWVSSMDLTLLQSILSGIGFGLLGGFILGLIGRLTDVTTEVQPAKTLEWTIRIPELTITPLLGLFGAYFLWKLGLMSMHSQQSLLLVGLALGLIFAFTGSYRPSEVVGTILYPNQGIVESMKNVARVWGGASLLAGSVTGITFGPVIGLAVGIAIFFTLAPTRATGGEAVIKHYLLRALLIANGHLPIRLLYFLEQTSKQRITKRAGGGFLFVHIKLSQYLLDRVA